MTDTEALHEWRQAAYQATRERDQARAAIARIRALHQPYPSLASRTDRRTCAHCNGLASYAVPWPCDTIQALDGEQP